jgi:hypothetical protein
MLKFRSMQSAAFLGIFYFSLLFLGHSAAAASLSTSPDRYLDQAAKARQSSDRPWEPKSGRLGNLRHVQIRARDCIVRVVSGNENRVFPGARAVVVVEQSRVLDANPNEQPAPRDVVLSTDQQRACPGLGSCGVSTTAVTDATQVSTADAVCFTLQLATAHDLLIGGDGLDLVVDKLQQPALRIAVNPSARLRIWLNQVDLGLLSIETNAATVVGGNGKVDFLRLSSSDGGSKMYAHEIHANNVGVSTTTSGTQWSIRIDPQTKAGYYQPARAPGRIRELYGIEIDGPVERLEIPAGSVNAMPLRATTRAAAHAVGVEMLARAGPTPNLPVDPRLPSPASTLAVLPRDASQIVADVAARFLPPSMHVNSVALWKNGGRIEGTTPSAVLVRKAVVLLNQSHEFMNANVGSITPLEGGASSFAILVDFHCDTPGDVSECPPGDPAAPSTYSEAQVRKVIVPLLGDTITIGDIFLTGNKIFVEATAPSESEANAALERLRTPQALFYSSTMGHQTGTGPKELSATLLLRCAVPPKPNGICRAPVLAPAN